MILFWLTPVLAAASMVSALVNCAFLYFRAPKDGTEYTCVQGSKGTDLTQPRLFANKCIGTAVADVPCGRQWRRNAKIVGGSTAVQGEFPWLVSLKNNGGHFCGGTIINKRWVLTAAHCLCRDTTVGNWRVTVGEHNLKGTESPAAYEVGVDTILLHPDYKCTKYSNDVALMKLDSELSWSDTVWPACFPGSSDSSFTGTTATVAGWGWLGEDTTTGRADILQKVDVPIVENAKCTQWYQSEGKKVTVKDSQMCAGFQTGRKDACWADSGGPLMVNEGSDGMSVVGVVSTGFGCARPNYPGIYSRITSYVSWIRNTIDN